MVLHFAAKGQGQFDGWVEDDENGIPTFFEARPNGFKERYWGQKSYCYMLLADTFTCATGDEYEVVSEVPVDVVGVKEIKNIGKEYEKLIKEGKFKVVEYNTSNKNTEDICNKRALKQLIDRGYFEGKNFRQRQWVSEHYKDIIDDYTKNKAN